MFVVYRMVSSTRLAACVEKSSSPTDASLTQSQLLNPLLRVRAHILVVMKNIRMVMIVIMMMMVVMVMVMVMIVIYDHEVARDDGNANQSDYY